MDLLRVSLAFLAILDVPFYILPHLSHVQFSLILTRLPLYLGVLLVCGHDFPSISLQFYPAELFFFLHIAIGRSFPLTWRRCNGGGSPCVLPFQAPCSKGILVVV